MSSILPTQVFGTFAALAERQRQSVISYLDAAWRAQYGRPPGTLSVDLEMLSDVYASTTPARKLRLASAALRQIPMSRPLLDRCLFIPVDERRGFITPEGRALLELGSTADLSPDVLQATLARLVDFYSAPRRDWIESTLVGGDLRPGTVGFVVFLLVNDSTAEARALAIPANADDEARLAAAVIGVVNAFSSGIGHRPLKGPELTRLRSNWVVTEAGRQLPGVVIVDAGPDRSKELGSGRARGGAKSAEGRKIYIAEGRESDAVAATAVALARRRGFTVERLRAALADTMSAYREASPLLKSWGRSWETERHSTAVCHDLELAVMERLDAGLM